MTADVFDVRVHGMTVNLLYMQHGITNTHYLSLYFPSEVKMKLFLVIVQNHIIQTKTKSGTEVIYCY